jgi:glycerol-3-phosphate dehydrogenase
MFDIVVIGCGIVGAAVAYELSQYQLSIAVLEKENDIAAGATKANSAIIHAGYDPEPGTLMAKLNVQGARLAAELCLKLAVPYRQIGSLVVAFSAKDLLTLRRLYERGLRNGVPDLRLLDKNELNLLEPNISEKALGAFYAPTAAIVNPWEYALALAETAVANGVPVYLNSRVQAIERTGGYYTLKTTSGIFAARYVINAAGVDADTVHEMAGRPEFKIMPNRGQYYLLDKSEGSKVEHIVFQCPTAKGKGVLITPTVHGNLLVGPNSENIGEREDTAVTSAGLSFVAAEALKAVPSLRLHESIRNFAGIRALSDEDDFIISESKSAPNFVNLAGIKSPGLSAAPAIAKMAVEILEELGLKLQRKSSFIDSRKKIRFKELSFKAKNELIKKNPAYGRVVCRCEIISEGEIIEALRSPIPPGSLDGIKRRCNAGMGRCQGSFCSPKVMEIIRQELRIEPEDIILDKAGSNILLSKGKRRKTLHV